MTYAANTAVPSQPSGIFLILRPKRLAGSFSNTTGNTWESSFTYGHVSKVFVDGTQYNLQTTLPLSSGTFYYDDSLQKLYIYSVGSPASKYVIAHYDIYISEESRVWYRDPTDNTTQEVFWEGALVRTPSWSQKVTDLIFGFFPLDASGIQVANGLHIFEKHIYDSSWCNADALVYHRLGELSTANIRKIFRGFTRNISLSGNDMTISLESIFRVLGKTYQTQKYFKQSDFPLVDPAAANPGFEWPIRKIYGVVEGLIPVNIDFNNTPGVTVNRDHVTSYEQLTKATITRTIDHTGTNTATTTTLTNADGIVVGDWVYLLHASASDHGVKVSTINYTTKQITHASIGARTVTSGDTCTRYHVGAVSIRFRDDTEIELVLKRDWDVSDFANNSKGIVLADDFESNFSLSDPYDPEQDTLYVRQYGETSILNYEVAGTPVTTAKQRGGNLNNIAATIYQFLREIKAYEDFDIDETSFATAISARTEQIGFAIPPERTQHDYPTYKEIITDLLQTGLLRMQINDFSGKPAIGLSVVGPLATPADVEIEPAQFADFQYTHNYEDIYSRVILTYAVNDTFVNFSSYNLNTLTTERYIKFENTDLPIPLYLHGVSRAFPITSLHVDSQEIAPFLRRVNYILSEREGRVSLSGKNDFILAELGDTYQVDREALPGYDFSEGTVRSRKFALVDSEKSASKVLVGLEEQKGIEDNSGSW